MRRHARKNLIIALIFVGLWSLLAIASNGFQINQDTIMIGVAIAVAGLFIVDIAQMLFRPKSRRTVSVTVQKRDLDW